MLPVLAGALRCPHCTAPVAVEGRTLRCTEGHSFDIARQGYVNLAGAGRPTGPGDTPAMVDRRMSFLAAGHYRPILGAIDTVAAAAWPREPQGLVIDVGAGPGWYLASFLDRHPERVGLAVDVSRAAAQRAARAHPRVAAIVADAWAELPIRSEVAACLLSVFAPRNAGEFRRVLAPGGALVVVSPTSRHLEELIAPLGLVSVDPDKADRLDAQFDADFVVERRRSLEWHLELDHEDVFTLVSMGPSAHHVRDDDPRRRIGARPDPTAVTAAVTVTAYRPRP